jgi:hypothetical protein
MALWIMASTPKLAFFMAEIWIYYRRRNRLGGNLPLRSQLLALPMLRWSTELGLLTPLLHRRRCRTRTPSAWPR